MKGISRAIELAAVIILPAILVGCGSSSNPTGPLASGFISTQNDELKSTGYPNTHTIVTVLVDGEPVPVNIPWGGKQRVQTSEGSHLIKVIYDDGTAERYQHPAGPVRVRKDQTTSVMFQY